MPFDVKNVRSIITYYQDEEPTDAQTGDVWFRPSDRRAYVKTKDGYWKRHFLKLEIGYGYVCGGYDGSNHHSTIDRFTFPFDSGTATHVGDLSETMLESCSCASSKHGYVCGGCCSLSIISRFEFPFDSGLTSNVGNLSGSRRFAASTSSTTEGYVCGGDAFSGSSYYLSLIDRFSFPLDSGSATHQGDLSGSRAVTAACSSSNYGYICGGLIGTTSLSIIDRLTFGYGATHVGNLSASYAYASACSSSQRCYVFLFNSIDRFDYPFDSGTAVNVGSIGVGRQNHTSCSSTQHGYLCGGFDGSSYYSTVDRITFPFDSGTTSQVGSLSGSRRWSASCSSVDPHLRW